MSEPANRKAAEIQFRLTGPGRLFLCIAAFLYFASLTSQSGLLLLLIGVMVACYPVNLIYARRSIHQLEIVPPPNAFAQAGQRVAQPWRLKNLARSPVGMITAETSGQPVLRVPYLLKDEEKHLAPELNYARRGVYRHADVRFSSLFPFGLLRASRAFNLPGEVVVYPKLFPVAAPDFGGSALMVGGKLKGHRSTATGSHFAGIRPFRAGDALKQIHWKSSGKGRGLMVKTFNEELAGRVSIFLNTSGVTNSDHFEQAVEAAGSLLFAALDEGHHVEWLDGSIEEPLLIPPFADSQPVLERLARIQQDSGGATSIERACELLSRKSALHLFLTSLNESIDHRLRESIRERRHVSIYLPVGTSRPSLPEGARLFFYRPGAIAESSSPQNA